MEITFRKRTSRRLVEWEVTGRSRRNRIRRSAVLGGAALPHDLEQLVVEAALGVTHGFWGSVANGSAIAWRGPGSSGHAAVAVPRRDPNELDHLVAVHVALADQGRPTPVAEPLARFRALWDELDDDGELTVEWPTLRVPTRV